MSKFFQKLSLISIVVIQIVIITLLLLSTAKAADTPAAASIGTEVMQCKDGIDEMLAQRTTKFEAVLADYTQLSDIPTMELLIRAKTGLVNLTTDAEEICQRNLSSDAPIPAAQRVKECRPEVVTATSKSAVNNTSEAQRKLLREQCVDKVSEIQKKYENIIMGFATWDMNNKKIYAYAKALEDLNLALRSFNEDFSIIKGRLGTVIQGINFLVSGKNAGQ